MGLLTEPSQATGDECQLMSDLQRRPCGWAWGRQQEALWTPLRASRAVSQAVPLSLTSRPTFPS